jgi:hypothetical protein
VAEDRNLTPLILQVVLNGAVQMQGPLPLEHTVRYSGQITIGDNDCIQFDNVSSQESLFEASMEVASAAGMLLTNPFEKVQIDSIDVKIDVEPENKTASIWAVDVDQTTVCPGQTITASAVLRSYRSQEEIETIDIEIPKALTPGQHKILILGASEYKNFISGKAPHKFRASDLASLKTGLNRVLHYRRDKLYAVMTIPSSGIVIREHELGQLPPTKMLLMQDRKRLVLLEPYQAWAENSITTDKIIKGTAEIEITVERE